MTHGEPQDELTRGEDEPVDEPSSEAQPASEEEKDPPRPLRPLRRDYPPRPKR